MYCTVLYSVALLLVLIFFKFGVNPKPLFKQQGVGRWVGDGLQLRPSNSSTISLFDYTYICNSYFSSNQVNKKGCLFLVMLRFLTTVVPISTFRTRAQSALRIVQLPFHVRTIVRHTSELILFFSTNLMQAILNSSCYVCLLLLSDNFLIIPYFLYYNNVNPLEQHI